MLNLFIHVFSMGGGRKSGRIRYIFSGAHSTIIIITFCEN